MQHVLVIVQRGYFLTTSRLTD